MKVLLAVLIALLLQACAFVDMTKDGEGMTWKSRTLWKDIEAVDASEKADGFNFELGKSGSALSEKQSQLLACLINPAFCE